MRKFLILCLIALCTVVAGASDTCSGKVTVKHKPVAFVPDQTTNSTSFDVGAVAPGDGYDVSVAYQFGKAPFTCSLQAPTGTPALPNWITIDNLTVGYCSVHIRIPLDAPDQVVNFNVHVVDADGETAAINSSQLFKSTQGQ